MIGKYFSGTGNSKYSAELFCKEYDNESGTYEKEIVATIKDNNMPSWKTTENN